MADDKTPAGVDPALWAEFQQLSDQVHKLHHDRELELVTPPPPTRRMVLDVPEEWFLLFAWISSRERQRRHSQDGATGLTAERIADNEQIMRKNVSAHLWRTLNNDFHFELQDLSTGASSRLRPLLPEPQRPVTAPPGNLDDDIPL